MGDDRGYNIEDLRAKAIERSDKSVYKIYYPGSESNLPVMIFQISSRNNYSLSKENDCIRMEDVSGAKAIARYSIGEIVLREVDLNDGDNFLDSSIAKGFLLTIIEYNPITESFDLKRMERVIGEEMYCEMGCDGVCVVKIPEG